MILLKADWSKHFYTKTRDRILWFGNRTSRPSASLRKIYSFKASEPGLSVTVVDWLINRISKVKRHASIEGGRRGFDSHLQPIFNFFPFFQNLCNVQNKEYHLKIIFNENQLIESDLKWKRYNISNLKNRVTFFASFIHIDWLFFNKKTFDAVFFTFWPSKKENQIKQLLLGVEPSPFTIKIEICFVDLKVSRSIN